MTGVKFPEANMIVSLEPHMEAGVASHSASSPARCFFSRLPVGEANSPSTSTEDKNAQKLVSALLCKHRNNCSRCVLKWDIDNFESSV
jgi:hypothetical protein